MTAFDEELSVPVPDPAPHPVCSKGTHSHEDKERQTPPPAQYPPTKIQNSVELLNYLAREFTFLSPPSRGTGTGSIQSITSPPIEALAGQVTAQSPRATGAIYGAIHTMPTCQKKRGSKSEINQAFPHFSQRMLPSACLGACLRDGQYWGNIHYRIYQQLQLRACPGWNKGVQGHLVTSVHSTHLQMGANMQRRLMEDLKWK